MALSIDKDVNKTGFVANYQKIQHISMDGSSINISVASYKDKATRDDIAKGQPVSARNFTVVFADLPVNLANFNESSTIEDILKTSSYDYLKTLDEFSGATDI